MSNIFRFSRFLLTPTSVDETHRFLGMISYQSKYIPSFSHIASPLFKLLQKNSSFKWSEECDDSFNILKEKLASAPILIYPDFKKPFIVNCHMRNIFGRSINIFIC